VNLTGPQLVIENEDKFADGKFFQEIKKLLMTQLDNEKLLILEYLADNSCDFLSIFNFLENNESKNNLLNDKLNFLISKFNLASQEKYFGAAYSKFVSEKMIDDSNIAKILQKVNESASKKLMEYYNNHELRKFISSCDMLNPLKMNAKPLSFDKFIEGFSFDKTLNLFALQNEYKIYGEHSKLENENPKNIESYWTSMKNRFPLLADLANNYLRFPICNCEVERSFSMYRYIFSERRKSFKEAGLRMHLFFAFNNNLIKKIYNFN